MVLYDNALLPWWDSEECYYERTIFAYGGGDVRIPRGVEREDAEVRIKDGTKTLKKVNFRDIPKTKH